MQPLTIDRELEFELKELYTITKNWQVNLAFVTAETQLLKKQLFRSMSTDAEDELLERAQRINLKIDRIAFQISKVQPKIPIHLKMLEYLVSGAGKYLSLDLIETHAELEKRNELILNLIIEVKAEMHFLSETIVERV